MTYREKADFKIIAIRLKDITIISEIFIATNMELFLSLSAKTPAAEENNKKGITNTAQAVDSITLEFSTT